MKSPRELDAGEPSRPVDALVARVYDELRSRARRYLRSELPGQSIEATALVHETYLRLARLRTIEWQGKTHFLAVAATQMRRVLMDHARAARASKRGGGAVCVTFQENLTSDRMPLDLMDLNDALEELARLHPRQQKVSELRLFAGLTFTEIASVVASCERTVRQDWTIARAWLAQRMGASRRRES